MEMPIVGKKADVINKRGVIALFNKEEETAMRYWCEARHVNIRHFDSTCNYVLYRWSTARIDDNKMMSELSEFVFDVPHKGQRLKACLLFAIGDTELGL